MLEGYKLVFDMATQPKAFDPGLVPIFILPAIGLILVLVSQNIIDQFLSRGPKGAAGKIFAWAFFLATSFIAVTIMLGTRHQAQSLGAAMHAGKTSVAEGCLRYFHAMPRGGHDMEKIQVGDRVLSYSDYVETPAFHNAETNGGPIHPDSRVRLTTVGDDIVRVEVEQKQCPPTPDFPAASTAS